MSTATKIHHSSVTLYSAGDCRFGYPVGAEIKGAEARRSYLAEFRERGTMGGAFFVDPGDYDQDDPAALDALCSAGPSVDGIDWTGFEA